MNNLPAKLAEEPGVNPLFTLEQIDLIKRDICHGASDDELKMFLWDCERSRLDPFARQIYSIERREKYFDKAKNEWRWRTKRTTQISIDGFRLTAERTGEYAGQLGPEWCGADGPWCDVWRDDAAPVAARVGVLRKDFEKPLWSVATLKEYGPKNDKGELTGYWAKGPANMLAKCAEALSLRRAFPRELSGFYTPEEMMQAHAEYPTPNLSLAEEMGDQIPEWDDAKRNPEYGPDKLHAEPSHPIPEVAKSAAAAVDKETSPPTSAAAVNPPGVNVPAPREPLSVEDMAREAAMHGPDELRKFYRSCKPPDKKRLEKIQGELVKLYPPINGD